MGGFPEGGAPAVIRLHGYWRSTAAYRVRIALALKGVTVEHVTHDLRIGEQRDDAYRALNPQGLVPALEIDGAVLTQSGAIIEWLEERYPDPPLLPADLTPRAIVRAMASIIGSDIHPINNLRVLGRLRGDIHAGEQAVQAWIAHWIAEGFAALEPMIAQHGGEYAFGDAPTVADVFLVPQLYSAERFAVDLTPYPALVEAAQRAASLPAFAAAHPSRQADAD